MILFEDSAWCLFIPFYGCSPHGNEYNRIKSSLIYRGEDFIRFHQLTNILSMVVRRM